MSKNEPFNPDEFAKWLVQGVKETLQYRLKQTLNREQILEVLKSKIPSRNQLFHHTMKQIFIKNGFEFEELKQGDAVFHVIRKKFKKQPAHTPVKRIVLIPGLGDTPTSWITTFAFCKKDIEANFDELVVVDFPGYLGFLSHTQMVPSMTVLLNVVQTVCEANPPTILIGHSLGGWLAGKVAQSIKKPIEHLLLVAPSGLTPENERGLFGDFVLSMQNVPFEALLKKLVHEPKRYHIFLKQEFDYFYSKPELKQFIESVKYEQFINPAQKFNCKKLSVVWGDEDSFVPSHWMRYWVECYGPYLDAYFVAKTGHLPQLERPQVMAQFFKAIFFNKTSPVPQEDWRKINAHTKQFYDDTAAEISLASNLLT